MELALLMAPSVGVQWRSSNPARNQVTDSLLGIWHWAVGTPHLAFGIWHSGAVRGLPLPTPQRSRKHHLGSGQDYFSTLEEGVILNLEPLASCVYHLRRDSTD